MALPITEGSVDFQVPSASKVTKTWYKVYGDIKASNTRPLVVLHGGPGFSHLYLLSLVDLTRDYGIPVVFYDQLGGGNSTHLPEKAGDVSFWTMTLFIDELDNLLRHLGIQDNYDLLGHSWGTQLGAVHALGQPRGLKRLILASGIPDIDLWGVAAKKLRATLPQDVQDTLNKHEADGTTDSKEYEQAVSVYYQNFVCRLSPMPEDVQAAFDQVSDDPTVYHTMWGKSEFDVSGSLKGWTLLQDLQKIKYDVLITNGRFDEAQDEVVEPFFRLLGGKVKWVQFANSSHLSHHEERQRFIQVTGEFLCG